MMTNPSNEPGEKRRSQIAIWESQYRLGLSFLSNRQLPSGEFAAIVSDRDDFSTGCYHKSVFITSVITYSIMNNGNDSKTAEMVRKAQYYIAQERDESGFWRYFGKGSGIGPDLDDTAYALLALQNHSQSEQTMQELLHRRNRDGIFLTWINELPSPMAENCIDWVVNANVLLIFYSIGIEMKEVKHYLLRVLSEGLFTERTRFYPSPITFLYSLSRLLPYWQGEGYEDLIISSLKANLPREAVELSSLHKALSISTFLNCRYSAPALVELVAALAQEQEQDGGWKISSFFTEPKNARARTPRLASPMDYDYYGSRELTTAFSVEAMWKYINHMAQWVAKD